MRYFFCIASFFFCSHCFAQSSSLSRIRAFRQGNEQEIVHRFFDFLQIPNVATDTQHIRKNADFLLRLMQEKGISNVQLLEEGSQSPPVVYGEVLSPGAEKTVVFYAHYDGQPVNAALWQAPLHPFQPQLLSARLDEGGEVQSFNNVSFPLSENWRIYARGASDDKGGALAIIYAYAAARHAAEKLPFNIKFFFEGEEEQGSPHLESIVQQNKALLRSDLWIICDGPVHQSGNKQVVFGARGDAHLRLKIYGPKNPLHSGHYGNWVPNPVMQLAKLLASMKDERGRVTVKNFYDDVKPLGPLEKKALQQLPDVDSVLKHKIGFAREEMTGIGLAEAIGLPSLNINGIESSNVGTIGANVIPVSATAVIDLRLVAGNDWKRQQQKLVDHIRAQGYYVTDKEPADAERMRYEKIVQVTKDAGQNAQRTPMDWPPAQSVVAAIQQTTTKKVLQIPTLGGTLPLDVLEKVLGARPLIVPIANYDNNQHAENENIRIGHLWEGIDMLASIMLMKW